MNHWPSLHFMGNFLLFFHFQREKYNHEYNFIIVEKDESMAASGLLYFLILSVSITCMVIQFIQEMQKRIFYQFISISQRVNCRLIVLNLPQRFISSRQLKIPPEHRISGEKGAGTHRWCPGRVFSCATFLFGWFHKNTWWNQGLGFNHFIVNSKQFDDKVHMSSWSDTLHFLFDDNIAVISLHHWVILFLSNSNVSIP